MAARTLGTSEQRPLTLEDRVNIAEGEDSEDDLDMIPGKDKGVSFDQYMEEIGMNNRNTVQVSSDDSEDVSNNRKRKAKGERVAFTDDEDSDAAFKTFQARKTVARKQEAAQRAKTKKRANKNSMVGKRQKTVLDPKKGKEKNYGDPSDDDEALMESTLPEYLQSRRVAATLRRDEQGDSGLQFPPNYENVEFSDDERLESLNLAPRTRTLNFLHPVVSYPPPSPSSCARTKLKALHSCMSFSSTREAVS
jgi:hypothetical protein